MKILKIVLIALVVIILLSVVGITVYLKTLDTTKLKDQISQEIGKNIDRKVSLGQLSFGFNAAQGVVLSIRNFIIEDAPQFSQTEFLKIANIGLALDIWPFVTQRQILVKNVQIDRPDINIIRLADGSMNIPQPKDKVSFLNHSPKELALDIFATPAYAAEENAFLKNLKVQIIKIKGGHLRFSDKMQKPSVNLTLADIDLTLNDFQFNTFFPAHFQLSLYSANQNIKGEAGIKLSGDGKQIFVQKAHVETDLSPIDLKQLARDIPVLEPAGLRKLEGAVILDVLDLAMVNNAIQTLTAKGQWANGAATLALIEKPIDNIHLNFEIKDGQLNLSQMDATIAGGKLSGKGVASNIFASPQGEFSLNLEGLSLSELSKKSVPVEMTGQINSLITLSFRPQEASSSNNMLNSILGKAEMEIKEGVVKNINLLESVLGRLSMFPNLKERLSQTIPTAYKDKLAKKDTTIDEFKVMSRIENSKIVIEKAVIAADGFIIESQGAMDLEQNLDLAMGFSIKEDLSKSMAEAQPELSYFLDSEGRINLPISPYRGPLKGFKVVPDLAKITTRALENRGKGELRQMLYKALDIKEGSSEENQSSPNASPSNNGSSNEKPEKDLIDGVLNTIFK